MFELIGGIMGVVARFYAWTIGLGLVVLLVVALFEGLVDLIRDRLSWRQQRPVSRRHA